MANPLVSNNTPTAPSPAGSALSADPPALFAPTTVRGACFQNRIWVSPMCQYSASRNGCMTDYHFVHLASFLLRGPSLVFIEATAVTPAGRISPFDLGLWNDEQARHLQRIVDFAHAQKQKIAIQLAHAGRKASTLPPWALERGRASRVADVEQGGWPDEVLGPTTAGWGAGCANPKAMTMDQVRQTVQDFASAAARAARVGVDVVEIHAAHGYLLSSFLSPLTNTRSDVYGGSPEGHMRLSLEVVRAVRRVIPPHMPLTFRISATEWIDHTGKPAWTMRDTLLLAEKLEQAGVDVLVISSGGQSPDQKIPRALDYQTSLAREIRRAIRQRGGKLLVGAVGRVAAPQQAAQILHDESGDFVLLGRQFLKEPGWVLRAAHELKVHVQWPLQYQLGRYGLETRL